MIWMLATVLALVHLAAPPAAFVVTLRRWRRARSSQPWIALLLLVALGLCVGLAISYAHARILRATVPPGQVLITCYIAIAALCLLRGLNEVLRLMLTKGMRTGRPGRHGQQGVAALVARAALLYLIGMPYLMGGLLAYRVKAVPRTDPDAAWGWQFESVNFKSADGKRVAAWWIPSENSRKDRTVILCHGFFSDKSRALDMARDLVPNGFNVLAIDLRGHGESGGQTTSFGAAERHDVLGAVRWLRANRAGRSRRIFGVGTGLGAAALLGAAADQGPDGQAIEALALYSAYDHPESVIRPAAERYLLPPLDAVAMRAGLPVAGLLAGGRVNEPFPLRDVQQIWPRPILFIHGGRDRQVPFEAGHALYQHALQPRYHYWLPDSNENDVAADEVVSQAVRLFFDHARSIL